MISGANAGLKMKQQLESRTLELPLRCFLYDDLGLFILYKKIRNKK